MINIPLHDTAYIIQGLQLVPIVLIVMYVLYSLSKGRTITHKGKLIIWSMFGVSVLAASVVYGLTLYDYVHTDRSIYKAENSQRASQQ